MPWNGSGQFNRTNGVFTGATVWDDSRVAGRTVRSDDHDTHDEDIATGLENTVTRDGQNAPTGNLPMGGFRHTGVGDAAARTNYASAGQIQDQDLTHIVPASVGGTADAITLSPTPAITVYAAGQRFSFVAEATNTGAATVDVSSLGTRAIQKLGAALVAGDVTTGDLLTVEYDGTQFQMSTPARTPVLAADQVINILDITDSNGNEVHSFAGVASAVNELATTNAATGNAPALSASGDDTNIGMELTPKGTGALDLTSGAFNGNKGADIASATTTDIGAATGNYVDITGTTTITGLGTVKAGTERTVQFDGALTLTHNATSLILPSAADIITEAGDTAKFVSLGSGNWKCTSYQRASGTALLGLVPATEQSTTSGTTKDFTGIAAGANRITVIFNAVSVSGVDTLRVQIGDSGGLETTSYSSMSRRTDGSTGSGISPSNGFGIMRTGATNDLSGHMVLTRVGGNTWISSHMGRLDATDFVAGGGTKTLSGELDRVRIRPDSADTFDNGSVNIFVEY